MVKKIMILGLFALVCVACANRSDKQTSEGTSEEHIPSDEEVFSGEEERSETPIQTRKKKESKTIDPNTLDATRMVANFITCKGAAEKRNDCRNSITKVIAETYDLTEFSDSQMGYVVYDSIRPVIERSPYWEDLGSVSSTTMERAIAHTNSGKLSLVIDTSQSYGHVVLLLSGDTKKSGSWGMELPKVLSLSNYKPHKSFADKTLAYAMQKSEDLHVYIRK